jgi:hypothetical protein
MIGDRQPRTGHGQQNGRRNRSPVVALVLVGFAAGTSLAAGGYAAHGDEIDQEQIVNPYSGYRWENGVFADVNVDEPNVLTFPYSINNESEITGEYVRFDEFGNPVRESGLCLGACGPANTFDITATGGTEGHDINDAGHVGGAYSADTPIVNFSNEPLGFLRIAEGNVHTIKVDNAAATSVNGINDRGEVVGHYQDPGENGNPGRVHGFYWTGGLLTPFDIPGAANTALFDINDLGQIVGSTVTADGKQETGFLIDGLGDNEPTIITVGDNDTTSPLRINDRGQIVGITTDDPTYPVDPDAATFNGFLLSEGVAGPVTDIRFTNSRQTIAGGLNDRTQIVGLYLIPTPASTATATDNTLKEVITSSIRYR